MVNELLRLRREVTILDKIVLIPDRKSRRCAEASRELRILRRFKDCSKAELEQMWVASLRDVAEDKASLAKSSPEEYDEWQSFFRMSKVDLRAIEFLRSICE